LSKKASTIVKVPCPYPTEVAAMSFFRLQIEVLEDVFDMIPVLHKKCICMINDYELDRG
jgi:hypothetical protein